MNNLHGRLFDLVCRLQCEVTDFAVVRLRPITGDRAAWFVADVAGDVCYHLSGGSLLWLLFERRIRLYWDWQDQRDAKRGLS